MLLWEAQSHGRGLLAWSLKKSLESEHPGPAEPSPSGVETSQEIGLEFGVGHLPSQGL